ncbi:MAG: hypothetical protein M1365_15030, partial [Actinobacteria bacterium]|nr:hypothetical protein [Actinomycetota bacterium]
NGGVVIASDETSLYDVNGDILSNYMLSDLFGVDYVGKTKSSYNYFKAPKKYSSEIRDGYSVYVDGPANLIRTNNEYAEVYGDIEIPFYEANDAMFFYFQHPRWKSVGPCLVYNKYYEGKVFYFPFKLFRSYANKIALPEHRKFFRNIIEDLGIELPIEVHCPLNVDVVILEDGSDYYVHLTGYNPTRQVATGTSNPQEPFISPSLMMEEPLTYEAYIKINVPFIDYEIEGDSRVLEEKGNIVKIIVKDVYKSIKISKK